MARKRNSCSLNVETLETRDLPSANPLALVGVVRDGPNLVLAGNQQSSNAAQTRIFGQAGDRYLSGDWNGDGKTDLIAVQANAQGGLTWSFDTNGDGKADAQMQFGLAGDTPFVGDFNGDHQLDLAVARANPQTGMLDWYIDTTRQNNANPAQRSFGLLSTHDIPVVGDWNGDGKTDLGVARPNAAAGTLDWYLDTNGDPFADIIRPYGLLATGDTPVTGDWNGDGKTDLGVVRNNANGLKDWYLDTNGDPFADVIQSFGFVRDTPVVGAWSTLAPVVPPAAPPPAVVIDILPVHPVAPPSAPPPAVHPATPPAPANSNSSGAYFVVTTTATPPVQATPSNGSGSVATSNPSQSVVVGNLRVVITQVTVPGASGNNQRISYSILNKTTGKPVRSNVLLGTLGTFGNDVRPAVAVTATGKVVVAWEFIGLGGNNNRILFQMINPVALTVVTGVSQANAPGSVTHALTPPLIVTRSNGTFSIEWGDGKVTKAADFATNGVRTKSEYLAYNGLFYNPPPSVR